SKGLVTSLTFRVKSVGTALVRFGDSSRVLLNDGKATDALTETASGYYQLALPPPAGPIVISETHPLQSIWYANPNVTLAWDSDPGVEGYSYVLNDEPADVVDDISEGTKNSIVYRGVADGTHYFHLKALRDETWGGTTHFAVRVDATPPASFPIEVAPGARTVRRQPVIQFSTTDFHSGIDHYELKIVPLAPENTAKAITKFGSGDEAIFVEAQSPYLTPALDLGTYDAIVRAYDRAGNYREVIRKLTIVNQIFQVVAGRGLVIGSQLTLPWNAVWAIAAVLIAFLAVLGWRTRVRHRAIDARRAASELPPNVRSQLDELKRFREKYGTTLALLFALGLSFALSAPVRAAEEQRALISPPRVPTVSRDISNEEIFYVGGRTDAPQTDVVLYLQDLRTGEASSFRVVSDKRGEWFYRHHTFLPSGSYLLWAQARMGAEQSPPSPQVQFAVERTAFQFGSTRLSFETLYLLIIIVLAVVLVGLILYVVFHATAARRKHFAFMKEVREAEESIRRGFAVLRRDIEAELAVVRKAKLSKELSEEERVRETQLVKDLEWVERYIGKEVWDVERAES
ncbi:MAG: hypothetical protein AAB368_00650, partial [bacterium]